MPVVFAYSRVEDCKNKMNSINDSTVINIDLEILSNEYSIAESIVIGVIWLLIQALCGLVSWIPILFGSA